MFFKRDKKNKKRIAKQDGKVANDFNKTTRCVANSNEASNGTTYNSDTIGVLAARTSAESITGVSPSTSHRNETDEIGLLYERQNEENDAKVASRKLFYHDCHKHPGHQQFIPVRSLKNHDLPPPYNQHEWARLMKLKAMETVRIVVSVTSQHRPDDLGFTDMKGTHMKRTGSGTAFIGNMDKLEVCDCPEMSEPHYVSGCFKVMTVAHVVFNDEEARNTVIEFFYDDDEDRSTVVTAVGVRVIHVDTEKNRSIIECRTHDLSLYQRLSGYRQEREQLIRDKLSKEANHEPMVVLISHPHGCSKCVSFGKLLNIQEEGDIRADNNGVSLIGCLLTYDTPTCPGSGGGSVNLIGRGDVCLAFAPHCASRSNGENISGLGWTKYVSTLQLRADSQ